MSESASQGTMRIRMHLHVLHVTKTVGPDREAAQIVYHALATGMST